MKRIALLLAFGLAAVAHAAELPASARIVYDVLYGGSELRIGQAQQSWRLEGGRYSVLTELEPSFGIGPRVRYESKGRFTSAGLVPETFAEYRNKDSAPRVRADFDWSAQRVKYGTVADPRTAALEAGAQDVNALPYQLAWLGERSARPMQVVTGRGQGRHVFDSGRTVPVTVNGQRMEAQPWRAIKGTDRTEVWLAPELGNLPVRIVRVDENRELQFVAREVQVNGR
ncbi:MAG TPA: DUF3108 domain-containing protein [Burkholderiaceae bacterium]|nr:DUF3108 domain-containing protein [Burkholderiaceae bacterium]